MMLWNAQTHTRTAGEMIEDCAPLETNNVVIPSEISFDPKYMDLYARVYQYEMNIHQRKLTTQRRMISPFGHSI